MPGMIQAVPGTNTIYGTMQATLPRSFVDDSTLWTVRWSNHSMRGSKTGRRARRSWTFAKGYWPYGGRMGFCNDPASPASLILQQDRGQINACAFEPWHAGPGGTPSLKFVMGRCKDASGNAIASATVRIFRSSTGQFVRETLSDENGYYEAGTEYPGQNHQVVAYVSGSPDRMGATVNTMVPTNRDGS